MDKTGAVSFRTQQEAYFYLENLPDGFSGRAYRGEDGHWLVSWRQVKNGN